MSVLKYLLHLCGFQLHYSYIRNTLNTSLKKKQLITRGGEEHFEEYFSKLLTFGAGWWDFPLRRSADKEKKTNKTTAYECPLRYSEIFREFRFNIFIVKLFQFKPQIYRETYK